MLNSSTGIYTGCVGSLCVVDLDTARAQPEKRRHRWPGERGTLRDLRAARPGSRPRALSRLSGPVTCLFAPGPVFSASRCCGATAAARLRRSDCLLDAGLVLRLP